MSAAATQPCRHTHKTGQLEQSIMETHAEMHIVQLGKQDPDQQKWDESPCLPLMHELESLHCSAQLLPPGLQLLVHSLSLIHAVCNLLQISLGYLCMNHTRCHWADACGHGTLKTAYKMEQAQA